MGSTCGDSSCNGCSTQSSSTTVGSTCKVNTSSSPRPITSSKASSCLVEKQFVPCKELPVDKYFRRRDLKDRGCQGIKVKLGTSSAAEPACQDQDYVKASFFRAFRVTTAGKFRTTTACSVRGLNVSIK
jgi:hypothetical protein